MWETQGDLSFSKFVSIMAIVILGMGALGLVIACWQNPGLLPRMYENLKLLF